jgi:lipoprotein-anchoring transpeptidase ErfK/SrfK
MNRRALAYGLSFVTFVAFWPSGAHSASRNYSSYGWIDGPRNWRQAPRYVPSYGPTYAPYAPRRLPSYDESTSTQQDPPRKSKRQKPAPVTASREPDIALPKGQLQVVVSLEKQSATLFVDGIAFSQSRISTGTTTHPTPTGVFSIIQKRRHHISNLYGAPMPYMQRITWSGLALHEGPLPGYPASHGCVRFPTETAQLLWRATKIGTRVIVVRDEAAPVPIEHEALLSLRSAPDNHLESQLKPTTLALREGDDERLDAPTAIDSSEKLFASVSTGRDRETASPASPSNHKGTVSVFISLAESRLYVRHNMQPLFDVPVTIERPGDPIGTHVFTALDPNPNNGSLRWAVVTIPSTHRSTLAAPEASVRQKRAKNIPDPVVTASISPSSAPVALERIKIPAEFKERIGTLVTPGASLIISDNKLSHETGRGTDFIVLTR